MESFLDVTLVVSTIGIAAVVVAGIWPAVRRAALSRSVAIGGTAIVTGWAGLAFVLAGRGFWAAAPGTKVPFIGLGVVVPIVAGIVAYRSSATVRRIAQAVPQHMLVGVQLYRVLGGLFLVSWAIGNLPGEFALPAGIGDVAIGLAAPVVAYALYRRQAGAQQLARIWNVLGIADLVMAVGTGFLTSPSIMQQLALDSPNYAITRFPLVLIPTFLVPVSVMLHFFSLKHSEAEAPAAPFVTASVA